MSSVKKDLLTQKGSLVTLYVKPRKSAKKNIYVIGGKTTFFVTQIKLYLKLFIFQDLKESLAVPGPGLSVLTRQSSVLTHSNRSEYWPLIGQSWSRYHNTCFLLAMVM